jgi:hypothetical protein
MTNPSLQNHLLPSIDRGLSVLGHYLDVVAVMQDHRVGQDEPVQQERLGNGSPTLSQHFSAALDAVDCGLAKLLGLDSSAPMDSGETGAAIRERLLRTQLTVHEAKAEDIREDDGVHDYIVQSLLPQFYFHITNIHAILRALGATIGKRDYLGDLEELYI